MNQQKNNNTKDIMYSISMVLLMTITVDIILTALLLILNISVSVLNFPLSIFIACFLSRNLKKKESIKRRGFIWGVSIVIILATIILAGLLYDVSWDGNAYHKLATGCLAYGWNPNYQTIEEFLDTGALTHSVSYSATWPNLFPKGNWFFAASIYKLTGSIECGKIINMLSAMILFLQSFSILSRKNSSFKSCLFSLVIACNPIFCSQIFTYYVDGALANFLFVMILNLYQLTYERDVSKKDVLASLFCVIVIMCNLKFTGLAMAGVFCFIVFIFWIIKLWKNNEIIKSDKKNKTIRISIFYIVTVSIAIFIVGSSSYVKNTILYHNPVYMVFGKDCVEMMKGMQPESFEQYNSFQKLFLSIFSRTEHLLTDPIILKIPFTFSKQEFYNEVPDTLRAGFGPFFSGVLILSLIIIGYMGYKLIKKHSKQVPFLLCMVVSIIFLAGMMDTCWVARYAPFIYVIPIIALLLVCKENKKLGQIIFYGMILLLFLDSISFKGSIRDSYNRTKYVNEEVKKMKEADTQITEIFVKDQFEGAIFNLIDLDVPYTILENDETLENYCYPFHISW